MFAWKDKYKFIFSDLGASDKVGVNDVGIGVFKKKPYIGLTKEIKKTKEEDELENKVLENTETTQI